MARKRLIVGAPLFFILLLLCIFASRTLLNAWESRQGQVGHHQPLPDFGYCDLQETRPCILSFSSNPDGSMNINILVKPRFRNFYIKIKDEKDDYIYTCKKPDRKSPNALCRGKAIPLGKTLSFLFILKRDESTFAEGRFPVIGLALPTPDVAITPTSITIDRPPR